MLPERRSTSLTAPEPARFDPSAEMDALNQRLRRYLDSWDRLPS